jgi:branched-chain amino acid transport system substrate-binding protein
MKRRTLLLGATAAPALGWAARAAHAAEPPKLGAAEPLKLGVLNDMSGVYSDFQGIGSVIAAQLAIEDFGGRMGERPIAVISGDHQNKPDVGMAIARNWLDNDGVDVILDVPNSAVALAVADLVRQKNRVLIGSGAGTADLTGKACSPNTVHWTYDTWEIGHSMGRAVSAQGGKRWFMLVADYAFGYDLENSMSDAVRAAGGTVLGSARHPLGTADFSTFLLQAKSSGADVLGLANAGGDTTTTLKQATEFGLTNTMRMAGPVVTVNTVQAIGLADSQGLLAVQTYYWDMNDGTRAFARRFQARHPRHNMPNDMQAGMYSATLAYLRAVAALNGQSADGRAVVEQMKRVPANDPVLGTTPVRVDGRALHPIYLLGTKKPGESKGDWDFFRLVSTVAPDDAFRPLAEGGCPLVKS